MILATIQQQKAPFIKEKLNYVATINPMEITRLNITITALNGTTMFFHSFKTSSRPFNGINIYG